MSFLFNNSPDTGWDTSACLVYTSGVVDHSNYYGVTSSYGRSPVLDVGDGNACLVWSNGSVVVSGWDVEYSYGNNYFSIIDMTPT